MANHAQDAERMMSTAVDRTTLSFDQAVRIPGWVSDLESFRRWTHSDQFPQRGRISYIQGEIVVDMSPEEIESHNKILQALIGDLWSFVNELDIGELLGDRVSFVNEDAGVSTEPDLLFCSWDSLRTGRVQYRELAEGSGRLVEVAGSPDLIVEIVSRSSVRKDTVDLPKAYFQAGVREFWLIDGRGEEIEFLVHRRGQEALQPVGADADGYRPSAVFPAAFRLIRTLNPVRRFRYQLQIRR